jgi:hypothetical protein
MSASTCTRFAPYDHLDSNVNVVGQVGKVNLLWTHGKPRICGTVKTFSQSMFTIRIEVRALQSLEAKQEERESRFTRQRMGTKEPSEW